MENPQWNSVDIANGIHVMVNGAGGRGHDAGFVGTRPDLFADEDSYCITRITLIDSTSATIETLGFGGGKNPRLDRPPGILFVLTIRLGV